MLTEYEDYTEEITAISVSQMIKSVRRTRRRSKRANLHHRIAALALLFLVNSHPISNPTGSMLTLNTPISTNSAYRAAVLFALTAQMRENQQMAMIGAKIRAARPRWCVKTRSKSGDVTIAATMPERRSAAPCHSPCCI